MGLVECHHHPRYGPSENVEFWKVTAEEIIHKKTADQLEDSKVVCSVWYDVSSYRREMEHAKRYGNQNACFMAKYAV